MPSATTSLAVLVADTSFVTALADQVIAEERAVTSSLEPAIAGVTALTADAAVTVAGTFETSTVLDALLDGTEYLRGSLSLAVAVEWQRQTDGDVVIAEPYGLTPDLDVLITDAVPIVLEPDAPTATPDLTMSDLLLGSHANVITSPTTDFAAAGVTSGDVLEILDGPNVGCYIVQSVDGNAVFVGEAPIAPSWPGPWAGELRRQRERTAQRTAALVIDQALFFAPNVRYVTLEMVIA